VVYESLVLLSWCNRDKKVYSNAHLSELVFTVYDNSFPSTYYTVFKLDGSVFFSEGM